MKPPAPQRSGFARWSRETLRNADTDQFVHVNHAVLCTFFETGRLQVFAGDLRVLAEGASLAVVHLELDFLREVHYPGTVESGTRVTSVGNSSISFAQALFVGEVCVAAAQAVCVLFDSAAHRARPVPQPLRERLLCEIQGATP
jgi:acyl-CoA thioester hydrolase